MGFHKHLPTLLCIYQAKYLFAKLEKSRIPYLSSAKHVNVDRVAFIQDLSSSPTAFDSSILFRIKFQVVNSNFSDTLEITRIVSNIVQTLYLHQFELNRKKSRQHLVFL